MTAMQTQRLQIYKCQHCGIIVEVLHEGGSVLTCCGEPMKLYTENSVDAAKEKHVPVVEHTADGINVTVGSIPHPMEEKHYIEWIEVIAGGATYRQFLQPGQPPTAFFPIHADDVVVREYCNLHGLWKA